MATSFWRAAAGNPIRFLSSSWPWRSLAYVAGSTVVAGLTWLVVLMTVLFPPVLLLVGFPVGAFERYRLRMMTRAGVPDPHAPAPPGGLAWLGLRIREAATWRELGYTACLLSVLLLLDSIAMFAVFICVLLFATPLLVATLGRDQFQMDVGVWSVDTVGQGLVVTLAAIPVTIVTVYGVSLLAGGQAAFARWLLAPTGAELNLRLTELAQSRNRLVGAFEAERRRIERDLHDGAQQHLLLLSMQLGLAEVELAGKHEKAGELVGEAHAQARMALAAIREQIRGIHPQILTDFGLVEAVRELAERCPVPVEVDLVLPGRPPAPVESTVYFVVSEALTNVVKHAGATQVRIVGSAEADKIWMTVTDDGRGGIDPTKGTGVRGLADRLAVMDGTLEITSPRGGPTVIRIELPCRFG